MSQPGRFQFGIRGMLLLLFSAAVGLSVAVAPRGRIADGLLATAVVWVVMGVLNQVRDLWATYGRRKGLRADERFGCWFAILWRAVAACLLSGCCIFEILLQHDFTSLPAPNRYLYFYTGEGLRDALPYIVLVCLVLSLPCTARAGRALKCSWLIGALGGIGGAVWCLLIWTDCGLLHCLTQTSLMGIESTLRPPWSYASAAALPMARTERFLFWTLLASGIVVASFALIRQLGKDWDRGAARRWLWGIPLLAALAGTVGWAFWLRGPGLRYLSPWWLDDQPGESAYCWITALLTLGVLATAAACRIVPPEARPPSVDRPDWRRNPTRYYHERSAVLLLLVLVPIADWIQQYASWSPSWSPWRRLSFPEEMIQCTPAYLPAALLIAAAQVLLARWRHGVRPFPSGPPRLPIARFTTVWGAMLIAVVFGAAVLVWLGFALWFVPWYPSV